MKDKKGFVKRTIVNSETAIEPYFYFRNGLLHIRYTVDRCIELSESEVKELKEKLSEKPSYKQKILKDAWKMYTELMCRTILNDGIQEADKRIKKASSGFKNKSRSF